MNLSNWLAALGVAAREAQAGVFISLDVVPAIEILPKNAVVRLALRAAQMNLLATIL